MVPNVDNLNANFDSSLTNTTNPAYNQHWYGAWVFFRYLSEKTNPDIIRQIYTNTITYYEIPAINNALTSSYSSNFNTIFKLVVILYLYCKKRFKNNIVIKKIVFFINYILNFYGP